MRGGTLRRSTLRPRLRQRSLLRNSWGRRSVGGARMRSSVRGGRVRTRWNSLGVATLWLARLTVRGQTWWSTGMLRSSMRDTMRGNTLRDAMLRCGCWRMCTMRSAPTWRRPPLRVARRHIWRRAQLAIAKLRPPLAVPGGAVTKISRWSSVCCSVVSRCVRVRGHIRMRGAMWKSSAMRRVTMWWHAMRHHGTMAHTSRTSVPISSVPIIASIVASIVASIIATIFLLGFTLALLVARLL